MRRNSSFAGERDVFRGQLLLQAPLAVLRSRLRYLSLDPCSFILPRSVATVTYLRPHCSGSPNATEGRGKRQLWGRCTAYCPDACGTDITPEGCHHRRTLAPEDRGTPASIRCCPLQSRVKLNVERSSAVMVEIHDGCGYLSGACEFAPGTAWVHRSTISDLKIFWDRLCAAVRDVSYTMASRLWVTVE